MSGYPRPLPPGARVEGLQVEEVLDQDALGALYLVQDIELGGRFLLHEYLPAGRVERGAENEVQALAEAVETHPSRVDAFLARARALATLEGPAFARVVRAFRAHGTACSLSPHVPSRRLEQALGPGGTWPAERVRRLAGQLADALEELHGAGQLHLGLDPGSVRIDRDGAPLLISLGLPHAAAADAPYRPPELGVSSAARGAYTDLYGLSATLFRCLAGYPPPAAAERQGALAQGLADPLEAALAGLPEGISGGLGEALAHGLELEPAARPRDVAHWRRALTALDWRRPAGEATPAPSRREWLAPLLLGAVLTAMAVAALWLWLGDAPGPGPAGAHPPLATTPAPPPERGRWEATLRADTLLAYRGFLEDHPGSVYAEAARSQLLILDHRAWEELAAEGSREAYADYLEQFPDGAHAPEALERIDEIDRELARAERERAERERRELAAWETAAAQRTVAAMDAYLAAWPGGTHADEARRIRGELITAAEDQRAWEAAVGLNTRAALQAYIDAFPRGRHVAAALETIDHLTLRPGKRFRDCPECPVMTVVPAGSFLQGAPAGGAARSDERPQRTVTLPAPFAIGVFEVSMAQWDACAQAGGCMARPPDNGWGRDARPVMMVSWDEVQAYLQWLGERTGQAYRLPSESEWEYAARAGQEGDWLGGGPGTVCEYGNVAGAETDFRWRHEACEDGHAIGTREAGAYRANAFGLFDVIGNVAEWTADCMNLSYLDAPVDGSAWGRGVCSSHVTRGGSWFSGPRDIRLPARFALRNGDRNDFTGFRVVRSVEN